MYFILNKQPGLLMIIDIFDERGLTRLPIKHGDPDACHFPLFDDIPILPIEYMYMVYLGMLMGAFGIMVGSMFKLSCLAFALCYWYIFFLDKTVWNNHSYLYGLISILLLLTNANYYWFVFFIFFKFITVFILKQNISQFLKQNLTQFLFFILLFC